MARPAAHDVLSKSRVVWFLAWGARNKGGQKRIETEVFGDHIIGDHVIIKKNVEEGFRGEQVALVLKDLHTQYRFVYPSQSKDAQSSVDGLNHFIGPKDDVQVVYTDIIPQNLSEPSKTWDIVTRLPLSMWIHQNTSLSAKSARCLRVHAATCCSQDCL